jgi:hypothetical protein
MDDELARALVDVLAPLATGIAVAIGGWIISKLPGPFRDVLTANVHGQDMARLVGAMQRRAMAQVSEHNLIAPTPLELIEYIERVRPDLLKKMQIVPEALNTIAQSAIVTATVAQQATPVVVVEPKV